MIPACLPFSLLLLGALLLASIPAQAEEPIATDWLLTPPRLPASVQPGAHPNELVLANGLIRRTFRTAPNFATVNYENLSTGVTVLRGVKPEAVLDLDGQRTEVGGLKGQPDYGYLDPRWLETMTASPKAFQFTGYRIETPEARYACKPRRHASEAPWPPRGAALVAEFTPPPALRARYEGLTVAVHYELYDGLPALAKWVLIANDGPHEVEVRSLDSEILAVTEQERHRLHVESNYAFAGMETTHWGPDLEYTSQVDYELQAPLLLTSRAPLGPGVRLQPGQRFESFRTFELLHDSDDRERQGLARRRMYRLLAPQVTENPILMHVRSADPAAVRLAIDQCAAVGFEMVIMTFGSGFNIESEDPEYLARMKALADYAHSKGIELGGYTLMCASRDVGPENDCISPATGKPGSKFGQSACLASEWADGYFRRVLHFLDATGMDVIETDGPFHGDVCASTQHAHHHGLEDSQWRQWEACVQFYHECRKRGIFIHTPDWYYLNGSNRCGMGYRETNFSLPRWRQITLARQNIFDGTFDKTPSMGWMFVPLVEYHGGGAAATMEPLSEHLTEYQWHLAQNFGSGVMACYRGPRLFDTDATRAVVKKWVDFYRKYRPILDSDLIHLRRPDGRALDAVLHVNPRTRPRALAMLYNPTDHEITTTLKLPLYYTGLQRRARIREQEGALRDYRLDRQYQVGVPLKLGPLAITWLVVE
jgi:hypothetical protein